MTINKIRTQQAEQRQKQKRKNALILLGVILGIAGLFSVVFWRTYRPFTGTKIQVPANWQDHVEEGTDPGPYTSNPPSSGRHFGKDFDPGFYESTDIQAQLAYPEGYLLHNLEHGYVILWYNCELIDDASCETLKNQIKEILQKEKNDELIAFPWNSTRTPLVMTSWGYLQEFDTFDKSLVQRFIHTNRNRSPESHAE